MSDYLFYLDDSGTKEYSDLSVNLFSYTGVILAEEHFDMIVGKLQELKVSYFCNTEPELKSHWLRRKEKRIEKYCDPYGISDRALSSFTSSYYELLRSLPIHIIGAVISKPGLKAKYTVRHFYPSSVCYEFLLQRIANYSHQYRIPKVSITFDDMSGKTPKGNEWKKLLIEQHKSLKRGSSPFYKSWVTRSGMNYDSIGNKIDFIDSAKSELIQLADLCAYNVLRQARDSWNSFDKEPFYYGYKQIHPIMHRNPISKRINGSGVVCYP